MSEAILLWLATLSSLIAMTGFALAMKTHWQQVVGTAISPRMQLALRGLGLVMLVMAAYWCLRADHVSMAILVWIMLMATAPAIVAVLLNRWIVIRTRAGKLPRQ